MGPTHRPTHRREPSRAIIVLLAAAAVLGFVAPAGAGTDDESRSTGVEKASPGGVGSKDVVVTNGSDQPVPTAAQGTTNVAGTVNVGNTPTVHIGSLPPVQLDGAVDLAGPVTIGGPVEVQGTVRTRPSLDGALSSVSRMGAFNNEEQPMGPFPAGARIGISSLTFTNQSDEEVRFSVGFHQFPDASATECPAVPAPDGFVNTPLNVPVAPHDTVHLSYPTGMVWPPAGWTRDPFDQPWCLRILHGASGGEAVNTAVVTAFIE